MSFCERNIDCLECTSRGMCDSYAAFKYNQALKDAEKRYREWSKSEYGKVVDDDALPIRVLRSLSK